VAVAVAAAVTAAVGKTNVFWVPSLGYDANSLLL